ncbi:hypothetical protein R6Q59_013598 [Mikania micrantha]
MVLQQYTRDYARQNGRVGLGWLTGYNRYNPSLVFFDSTIRFPQLLRNIVGRLIGYNVDSYAGDDGLYKKEA